MTSKTKANILVIDDEKNIIEVVKSALADKDRSITVTHKPERAVELIQNNDYDLILTDLKMEPMDGLQILKIAKEKDESIQVLMMTAFATVETALNAMKIGAYDYIMKPFKLSEIDLLVQRALNYRATLVENDNLKALLKQKYDFNSIIGESTKLVNVLKRVQKVADSDATVFITGESGTGKELIAKSIFTNSKRSDQPFVSINCGALTETLLESELFGHVKGAFTGAYTNKTGLFQAADGGTIFLDEIGLTSQPMQMRLLRVLQEREIRRVGDTKDLKVDVRVIAATNDNLEKKVKDGSFREDLYYRLSVFPIHIPPLRERDGDVPLLVNFFLRRVGSKMGKTFRPDKKFLDLLCKYNWPGNIRELENIIERSVLLAEGQTVNAEDLPDEILYFQNNETANHNGQELKSVMEEAEKKYIESVLRETNGNKKLASRILNIDPATLYRKTEKLGISSK